jgi:hypothetical protein
MAGRSQIRGKTTSRRHADTGYIRNVGVARRWCARGAATITAPGEDRMQHPPEQSVTSVPGRLSRAAGYAASATAMLLLVVVVGTLALGPVHGVKNAAACERAYAEAKTRTDSISVELLSFPDPAGRRVTRRCGELHPANVQAPGH